MTEEWKPQAPDPGKWSLAAPAEERGKEYLFMTVKAIRGREAAAKAKWQGQGWEFVSQRPGPLRSELDFRKIKKKAASAYLAQGYAAFQKLESGTQRALLGVGALVLLGIVSVIGIASLVGGDGAPEVTPPGDVTNAEPKQEQEEGVATEPAAPKTSAMKPYQYDGPAYRVAVVDQDQGPAQLSQHWVVLNNAPNLSTNRYRDLVKLAIADVARKQESTELIVQVVTDERIALAESSSTYDDFVAEYGADYAVNEIPKLEVDGWIASYTGGFDANSGRPSDAESAFEVLWRPYASSELETWAPEIARR